MIHLIKEAVIEKLNESEFVKRLPVRVFFTASESEDQPTDNSPLFQLIFMSSNPPELIPGFGDPSSWVESVMMQIRLSVTKPEASLRALYEAFLSEDDAGRVTGIRPALNELIATGLLVGDRPWRVEVGETRPRNVGGVRNALEAPIQFTHAFSAE